MLCFLASLRSCCLSCSSRSSASFLALCSCSAHLIFLPHNERGSSSGDSWRQRLVPSVAELLVWAETACMADYSGFQSALTALRECKGSAEAEAIEQLDSHIQRMQMVVRKRG